MRKQSAYAKTKTQISFAVTAKLISAFVCALWIVQLLYFLNPKFQASSQLLCLYSSVCVEPVWKPHCWFSHEAAHFLSRDRTKMIFFLISESVIFCRVAMGDQVQNVENILAFLNDSGPLYNTVRYSTVLDTTRTIHGPQSV